MKFVVFRIEIESEYKSTSLSQLYLIPLHSLKTPRSAALTAMSLTHSEHSRIVADNGIGGRTIVDLY